MLALDITFKSISSLRGNSLLQILEALFSHPV